MNERLLLLDSFALAFRVFYAFSHNPLKNAQGEDISLIHGYWSLLLRMLAAHPPTHFAIVRDMGRTTFRTALYPDYKANRSDMPEEMSKQLPWLESSMWASGLPILGQAGYEADDIMASLARMGRERGWEVWLATADKDMAQMVGGGVKLFQMDKGGEALLMGPEQVRTKFGVPPEKMRDYLALVGDTSDNIPGVHRVGPKTAVSLLEQFDGLEEIYANLESVEKKTLRQYLSDGRENAFLSRELVTLQSEKDFGIALESLRYRGVRKEALHTELHAHQLNAALRLLAKVPDADAGNFLDEDLSLPSTTEPREPGPKVSIADSPQSPEWEALQNALQSNPEAPLALMPLTDSGDLRLPSWIGLGLALEGNQAWYIPLRHEAGGGFPLDAFNSWLASTLALRPLLAHDTKSILHLRAQLEQSGVPPLLDTLIAAWLLQPGQPAYPFETLAAQNGALDLPTLDSLLGKGKLRRRPTELNIAESAGLAGAGAAWLQRLWPILQGELEAKHLWTVYQELEVPMIPCLADLEAQGICLDSEVLKTIGGELRSRIGELETEIHRHAGHEFNIASPKQLSEILYEELGLTSGKKTATGFSTAAEALEELREFHPIIDPVLEYRELQKLLGTYVDVLPTLVNPQSGRLHTHYLQTGTATGRLSSKDPNLQNIPIRTQWGRRVRAAFVARPGHVLLSADYSQIELRVLAHLSGDAALCNAYRAGADIHASTAAAVFGLQPKEVSADHRRQAKAVNFGVLYGMSAFRLARDMGMPRQAAVRFIEGYFAAYPGVAAFIEAVQRKAREDGYVETLAGRRRWLPGIDSTDAVQRAMAGRMATNSPIQGGAADILTLAMLRLHRGIRAQHLPLQMLLQVHDELVFECPADQAEVMAPWIRQEMEAAWALDVPLVAEVGIGKTWLEAH